MKVQRQERVATFEKQNGALWCSWIPPRVEMKEVYERGLDIQAEVRLCIILQVMARIINNVSEDGACRRNMKYEPEN